MGFLVLGIDRNPDKGVCERHIRISTYNTEEILEFFKKSYAVCDFRGVLSRVSGVAVVTAAELASLLKVHCYSRAVADRCLSKWALYTYCKDNNIPTIESQCVSEGYVHPEDKLPMVIKPDQPVFGKKNVYRISNTFDFNRFLKFACEESLNKRSIVQPFIPGEDIGVSLVLQKGDILKSIFWAEKNYFSRSIVVPNGVVPIIEGLPSSLSNILLANARRFLYHDLSTCFLHLSFRLPFEGPPPTI
jgi:hypothetical protein